MALRTNTVTRHFASNTTAHSMGWTKVFTETSGGSFTDVTTAASSESSSDVTLLGASGDKLNLGSATPFDFVRMVLGTPSSGGTRAVEYWNGSSWTALTVSSIAGGVDLTSGTNELSWTPPTSWATTTVNSVSAYWIRFVNTGAYGTPGTGTSFAPGNLYDFGGSMTFDIAETSSRTIRAVVIRTGFHTSEVVPVYQTRISCKLGAAAASYVLDVDRDWGPSEDSWQTSLEVECDATSYFVANFGAGASQTLDLKASITCQVAGATGVLGTLQNAWARVTVTYEYDDASLTTATKTVYIPIESGTGALTTSLAEIGTNQVPLLDTFCPEASKTFKEICFVMQSLSTTASGNNGTANVALALDAESEVAMCPLTFQSGDTALTKEAYHWIRNDLDTSAVHAFKARTTDASILGVPFFGGYLAVTYTYNAATSTSVLNSLMFPLQGEDVFVNPGNASADSGAGSVEFWVAEPATVTLKQSAVLVSWHTDSGGGDLRVKVGGQSFRTYNAAASRITSVWTAMQRLDSGGAQGSGLTLARGKNRLTFEYYGGSSSTTYYRQSAVNAFAIVNYTSGKAADGVGAHNHTTLWPILTGLASTSSLSYVVSDAAPVIPEADYFINSVGYAFWLSGPKGAGHTFNVKCERKSGEGPAAGWVDLLFQNIYAVSTDGHTQMMIQAQREFLRGSWDLDDSRMDVTTARRYVIQQGLDSTTLWMSMLSMYLTYHAVTFAWAGTVTNASSTAQVGATVTLHRNDTGEIVGTATTDGSGNYSIPWFDDTVEVHSQVRISGSLLGRSDDGNAA